MIIALLSLLVLSVLVTGVIFVTQTEIWTTANYRQLAQARYAAEAGVQATINWLQYTYTAPTTFTSYTMTTNPVQYSSNPVVLSGISVISSNYPDSTQQTAYNTALSGQTLPGLSNASFSTSAKLISMTPTSSVSWLSTGVMQTWQITSVGSASGVARLLSRWSRRIRGLPRRFFRRILLQRHRAVRSAVSRRFTSMDHATPTPAHRSLHG